jgi:transcription elongation factor SPT6
MQAMYRKEECGDLLSLRYDDTPETTGNDKVAAPQDAYLPQEADKRHPKGSMQAKHRRIRRWDVLWAVHNCAVRFFDMYKRRVQRMDSYLKVRVCVITVVVLRIHQAQYQSKARRQSE